jgi:hypothetical protein
MNMGATTHLETHPNYITAEFRLPTPTSLKKRWYVTIKCEKCGREVEKVYQKTTWNYQCNPCSKGRLDKKDVINILQTQFGDTLNYSDVDYVNNKTPITITCPIHGAFSARLSDIKTSLQGCPKCSYEKANSNKEYTIEKWNKLIKNSHVKLIEKYNTFTGKFICDLHGEYEAHIHQAVSSQSCGCSICAILNHQKQSIRPHLSDTTGYLYYVYFPFLEFYKLGVTSNINNRFNSFKAYEIKWIKEMNYKDAVELEHELHKKFYKERYYDTHLLKEGSYELYTTDIFPSFEEAIRKLYHE